MTDIHIILKHLTPIECFNFLKEACEDCFQMDIFKKNRCRENIYPRYCLCYFLLKHNLIGKSELSRLIPFDRSTLYNILEKGDCYIQHDDDQFMAYWEKFNNYLTYLVKSKIIA